MKITNDTLLTNYFKMIAINSFNPKNRILSFQREIIYGNPEAAPKVKEEEPKPETEPKPEVKTETNLIKKPEPKPVAPKKPERKL
jgi:outer membrane biosynthesis protein TonB